MMPWLGWRMYADVEESWRGWAMLNDVTSKDTGYMSEWT